MKRLGSAWKWLIPCVLLLIVILIPMIRYSLTEMRRGESRAKLKQIGLALQAYHEQYDSFPPAYTVDDAGRKLHSWRTLLLPYLGEQQLFAEFRLNEPWDSPHNHPLVERRPDCYRSPLTSQSGMTCFLAIVGKETAWLEQYPSTIQDLLDGPSTTIQLLEEESSPVKWSEPRDLSFADAQASMAQLRDRDPSGKLGQHALLSDGVVRYVTTRFDQKSYRALLTARSGRPFPRGHFDDLVPHSYEFGPAVQAKSLPKTNVLPFVSAPLSSGKNIVWCATFQIAWDQIPRAVDEPRGDSLFMKVLDQHPFDLKNLAPESYLALGGSVEGGIRDRIDSEMARRFPDVTPALSEATERDELVIYAFLRKLLPFSQKFTELAEPLGFITERSTTRVRGFGYEYAEPDDIRDRELREQVTVLDYVSADDFILRLSTQGELDEILLAKVAPRETLAATWEEVEARIRSPRGANQQKQFQHAETLRIPKLLLNVERQYDELTGSSLSTGHPIRIARQMIRFRLDESGAILESESEIIGEFGHDEPKPMLQPRHFRFDRPFLLALRERAATLPYLLIWIANAELMELVANP